MSLSVASLLPILDYEIKKLMEKIPSYEGGYYRMESRNSVEVVMQRVLVEDESSREYKVARVSITPPNEELASKLTEYFQSKKNEDASSFLFDKVMIGREFVIDKSR